MSTYVNEDVVKGKWKEIKGKVSQQWNKLTDDTVSQMGGSFDELSGKLQKTYGYSKEKAKQEVETFLRDQGWLENNAQLSEDFEKVKEKLRETREALAQAAYDVKDKAGEIFQRSFSDVRQVC